MNGHSIAFGVLNPINKLALKLIIFTVLYNMEIFFFHTNSIPSKRALYRIRARFLKFDLILPPEKKVEFLHL